MFLAAHFCEILAMHRCFAKKSERIDDARLEVSLAVEKSNHFA